MGLPLAAEVAVAPRLQGDGIGGGGGKFLEGLLADPRKIRGGGKGHGGSRFLAAGGLDHRRKGGRLVDRQIGQNFPVQLHPGLSQSAGKGAVVHPLGLAGRAEPGDPQISEIPFLGLPVAVRPVLRLHRGVFGVTEKFAAAAAVSGGAGDYAFAAFTGGGCIGGAGHGELLSERQVFQNPGHVGFVQHGDLAQTAHPLPVFAGGQMAAPGLAEENLAAARHFEALGGGLLRLSA